MNVLVIVTEAVSPRLIVAEAALKVSVSSNAAFAVGAPESKPKLRAVTTASAIRLKVIFDIFVLSFSRTKDVLRYGWRSELRLVMQCTCYCTTFSVVYPDATKKTNSGVHYFTPFSTTKTACDKI
jgi:hypothetical protein